jgi:putative spermidine/putrescine transport system permease protein
MMSDRLKTALRLAPALLVTGGLFLGGLVVGLLRSLGMRPLAGEVRPDLAAYRAVLGDPDFLASLALTLHIAFTSTVLAAAVAVAAALLIRSTRAGRAVIIFLFQLNLTVPHVVGAIGILYLFGQSGSFARLAHAAGLIDRPAEFPALLFDPWAAGIILTYVWKEVPFIGLVLLAQMRALGTDYEAVARTLGASRWQAFRHVLLPMILPGLLAACAIVFAFAFGAYEIPALLGASHPQALPVLLWRAHTDVDLGDRPQAMAMAVVIALLAGLVIRLYLRAARARIGR